MSGTDTIRTLILVRTHAVVLDADRVASALTRPARFGDLDRFEAELVELGYVMSLDLAMTIRRLPHQAIEELRAWIVGTLTRQAGAHRPQVPLFRGLLDTPEHAYSLYVRRVMSWLATRPEQPCPWCNQRQAVGALDPCGHLVCRVCWSGGSFAGCPICHRRVVPGAPFLPGGGDRGGGAQGRGDREQVYGHGGELRVLQLAFDVLGVARDRFARLLAREAPLARDDRAEIDAVIDAMGPRAAAWLPARIPVPETMARAVARLWLVAPDRSSMASQTAGHLRTATDVLRVTAVLMGADPALPRQARLRSICRASRRAVLESLERLPAGELIEDMRRHRGLWKRAAERLHPFELAEQLPGVALAFAALRRTDLEAASFGAAVRAQAAAVPNVRIADGRARAAPWGAAVEDALRAGDARGAAALLAERPAELLRRADHVARAAAARQPEALGDVLAAIRRAIPRGAPAALLALAAHAARRGAPWPRRVFLPGGDVLRPWTAPDRRPPLPPEAIAALVDAARAELVVRAEARPRFPRAILDRGLAELPAPARERAAPRGKLAWPRGSELALPEGEALRLVLHWEQQPGAHIDLDLAVALFDADWRHLATCDHEHPAIAAPDGAPAAAHSGDLTAAPPPLGATEAVELRMGPLAAAGARHLVATVRGYHTGLFDRLPFALLGVTGGAAGAPPEPPEDPRAAWPRFDLRGPAAAAVPLAIDLEARRLRWLDVHLARRGVFQRHGGYRAGLAHLGRDFEHLLGSRARPTLWEVAAVHAAARANVIYVRGPGGIETYRRRDGEPAARRLARLLAGEHDGVIAAIPTANAPTWVALLRDDLPLPAGSAGYVLDARRTGGGALARAAAADLIAELAPLEWPAPDARGNRRPPAPGALTDGA